MAAVLCIALLFFLTPKVWKKWVTAAAQTSAAGVPSASATNTSTTNLHEAASAQGSASEMLKNGGMQPGNAETRLIEIFSLIENSRFQEATSKSQELIRDQPNFHLAQLIHADLLTLRFQPKSNIGKSDIHGQQAGSAQLAALRAEAHKRLTALRERPPSGHIPHQFLSLAPTTRHAIAVDASRSRLYLFENMASAVKQTSSTPQLRLVADFFISVGKSGINKRIEGDGRTPLGTYYITSVREKKSLPEFYGAGALPINYPNALDTLRGRTGSGIWLHGTPPNQFVRGTLASEGCVVLSNPDMELLLKLVAPRTTPVVVTEQIQWITPAALEEDRATFESHLNGWQQARSSPQPRDLAKFFSAQFSSKGPIPTKFPEMDFLVPTDVRLGLTQLSLMQWHDQDDLMVATFEETVNQKASGVVRRQYWIKQPAGWLLFNDHVLSGAPSAQLKRPSTDSVLAQRGNDAPNKPPRQEVVTLSKKAAPEPTAVSSQTVAQAADVRQAVVAWARAWGQKDMPRYLGAYDAGFAPPDGLSRKAWEQERRDRIVHKSRIAVSITNLQISMQGNTATAVFVQNYQADQLKVSSKKTLKLAQRNGKWLITRESVGNR